VHFAPTGTPECFLYQAQNQRLHDVALDTTISSFRHIVLPSSTWEMKKYIVSGAPLAVSQGASPYGWVTMGRGREKEP